MFKVKDIFTWGFKAAQGIAVDLYKLSHEDIPIHYAHIKTDFDTVLKYLREVPGVESAMQATPEQIKQIMPRINYDASLVVGKVPEDRRIITDIMHNTIHRLPVSILEHFDEVKIEPSYDFGIERFIGRCGDLVVTLDAAGLDPDVYVRSTGESLELNHYHTIQNSSGAWKTVEELPGDDVAAVLISGNIQRAFTRYEKYYQRRYGRTWKYSEV